MTAGETLTFDLRGSMWPDLLCLVSYAFCMMPAGMFLLYIAGQKLWLWHRARHLDDARLTRAIHRLDLEEEDDFKGAGHLGRFRKRGRLQAWGGILLALFPIVLGVLAWVIIPWGNPVAVTVGIDRLVLDYRWPRSDRKLHLDELASVVVHKTIPRKSTSRTVTELRLRLRDGRRIAFETPGYRGDTDQLRLAAEAIAKQAGVLFKKTVDDHRMD